MVYQAIRKQEKLNTSLKISIIIREINHQEQNLTIKKEDNMRHKKVKFFAVILLSIGLTELKAQETITATGGNATGIGGTVSYTVGQLVYTTNIGTTGSIAQGVQQPYEISVVSGVIETTDINLICSAYPNPTTDFLMLKVENYEKEKLTYQLYDISGKLLESKNITNNETTISMRSFVPAPYFLKVSDGKRNVKTFKIIKN